MSKENEITNLQDLLGDLSVPDDGDNVEFVAVIGAGVMGQGIARTISAAGIDVVMIEKEEERIEEALQNLTRNMEHEISRWAMT
ncbi:MAG: NAD(P)-binding domain-containing protein, partial [Melioribacteraceae bacterium]|nr:NAD(P)-binding domain-containing protein [Melioribacteraceae bacterium]